MKNTTLKKKKKSPAENKLSTKGWGYSIVVECLPSMLKALSWIPSAQSYDMKLTQVGELPNLGDKYLGFNVLFYF
jgi:hypothetical protein